MVGYYGCFDFFYKKFEIVLKKRYRSSERIKNIFEKMINKKRYVFVGMCFLWMYFAGGWTSVF